MSRARKLAFGLAMLGNLWVFGLTAIAQRELPPLSVNKIAEDVYWTQGANGGNTGIIIGKDGVIVFDTKSDAASGKAVLAEIAKLTPKPVTTVILSHSDGDHVNGLAGFPTGLTIISTPDCKREMEETKGSRDPAPQDHLPNKIVDKREDITINGVHLVLIHTAPAHTDGDLQIFLPDQKIVFAGDIITAGPRSGTFSYIDAPKHGTAQGWLETAKALAALKAATYVAGHGGLYNKAELQARVALVSARYEQIKLLVSEGKTLPEIKLFLAGPDLPGLKSPTGTPDELFTTVVYNELSKKN